MSAMNPKRTCNNCYRNTCKKRIKDIMLICPGHGFDLGIRSPLILQHNNKQALQHASSMVSH